MAWVQLVQVKVSLEGLLALVAVLAVVLVADLEVVLVADLEVV